jgi:putative phage-type endonuclease
MAIQRLVSTVNLPKEQWLRYRKKGITGTDAGAITGMNPFVSAVQVYFDKTSDEIEEFDNEAMRQGRDLEEYVAQRFCEETGFKVRRANAIYQNVDHPIMLADFDRLIVGQRAGLECKTVSAYSADKWKDGAIPLHYLMQVQHYLAVSDFDCWYVAALIMGKEFIIRKIERDEELIQYLITIEERFWNEHVVPRIMPEPDGSSKCSELIASMYFKSDKQKSIELNGFAEDLNRRSELVDLIAKMEKEKDAIDQKIKLEMQDAAYAITDKYKISWLSSEAARLDTKKLKEDYPELYKKYCKTTSSRRFTVSAA